MTSAPRRMNARRLMGCSASLEDSERLITCNSTLAKNNVNVGIVLTARQDFTIQDDMSA
jgi:hypothetical protein